jgi:hypothetical protein
MNIGTEFWCDCFGMRPWPAMLMLHVGRESSRYYVCPRCGTVREDVLRPDGTVVITHFHSPESVNLPDAVVERAQDILAQPHFRQLPLFND